METRSKTRMLAASLLLPMAVAGTPARASLLSKLLKPKRTVDFILQPSSSADSGAVMSRQPVIWVENERGLPFFRSLKDVRLDAFLDAACTVPAGGTVTGELLPGFAFIGLGFFRGVSYSGEGDIHIRVSVADARPDCSDAVRVAAKAHHIELVAGDRQTAIAGSAVAVAPKVRVVSAAGRGMAGVALKAEVTGGGGRAGEAQLVTDASGYASTSFVTGAAPGTNTLRISRAGVASSAGPWSVTFTAQGIAAPVAATSLALSGPASAVAGSCAGPFEVSSRDARGRVVSVDRAVSVSVSGRGQATLHPDAACAAPLEGLSIASGQSSRSFYLRDTRAGSLGLSVSAEGMSSSGAVTFALEPGAAKRLGFAQQPASAAVAGAPLAVQPLIRALDAFGNPVPSFTGEVTLAAASDAECLSAAPGALAAQANPLPAQQGGAAFAAVRRELAGEIHLKASAESLDPACSARIAVSPAAPSRLAVASGDSQSSAVGTRLAAPLAVRVTDAFGNPIGGAPVSFSIASGGGALDAPGSVSDAQGLAQVSLTLPRQPGAVSVRARGEGGDWGEASPEAFLSATAVAGAPASIRLSGPVSTRAGECSQAFSVSLHDSFGNAASAGSELALAVGGAGAAEVHPQPGCGGEPAAPSVAAGAGGATFHLKGTLAENQLLSIEAPGLAPVSLPHSVRAAAPAALALRAQPDSSAVAGIPLGNPLEAAVQDSFGNVVREGAVSISLAAYSDAACTVPASGALAAAANPASSSEGVARFSGVARTLAGVVHLGLSAQGLAPACSSAVTLLAGPADRLLVVAGDGQTAEAGATLGVSPRVRAVDAHGNAAGGADVRFAVISGGGSVAAGQVRADDQGFAETEYTLGSAAGENELEARLAEASSGVRIHATGAPRAAAALALSGPSSPGAGQCAGPYEIALRDGLAAPTVASGEILVSLDGAGDGEFHADAACSRPAVSVTIARGAGNAQVYYTSRKAVGATLAASAPGLSGTSLGVTVAAAAPAVLSFSSQPSGTADAGAALVSQPALAASDAFGNLTASFASNVTLAAFSDAACAVPASGSLTSASNPVAAVAGHARFDGVSYDSAGTIHLLASADGLASACSGAIVVSSSLQFALGAAHTCLLKNGGVKCWGFNGGGNLGTGSATNSPLPVQVHGLAGGVSLIASGGNHTCAALQAGGVSCWGSNASGQLGNGTAVAMSNVPVSVSGLAGQVQGLASGESHVCALSSGAVSCWGLNNNGQLGTGGFGNSPVAAPVAGLPANVKSIAAGSNSTCALTADGTAYCWGRNGFGQLGNLQTQDSASPVRVQGLGGDVLAIVPGYEHTCAVLASGIECFGRNQFGQLGNGSLVDSAAPVRVVGLAAGEVGSLSGGYNFNCVTTGSGAAKCWGHNARGQLGNNRATGPTSSSVPVQVQGMAIGARSLQAGSLHACAADPAGLKCWGWGRNGQLGDGGQVESYVPVLVQGI